MQFLSRLLLSAVAISTLVPHAHGVNAGEKEPPAVGDEAPEFKLDDIGGKEQTLSPMLKKGPVVLVVLRGYPGYQCPVCSGQVSQLLQSPAKFEDAKATVVLVYPGPADQLKKRASEFIKGKTLPDSFHLLLDPDYEFTNDYGLRWDAEGETAYPATFVIDREGVVKFSKVSDSHGGRSKPAEILKALQKK